MVKSICIIDDEDEILDNLKIEINHIHPEWKIVTYSTGLSAIKDIYSGKFDIVLTDIAMPDMDGYEIYWRVKDYNPQLPVIMMTGFGYDPNHVLVRSRHNGLEDSDIIYKPFDYEQLSILLENKLKK